MAFFKNDFSRQEMKRFSFKNCTDNCEKGRFGRLQDIASWEEESAGFSCPFSSNITEKHSTDKASAVLMGRLAGGKVLLLVTSDVMGTSNRDCHHMLQQPQSMELPVKTSTRYNGR